MPKREKKYHYIYKTTCLITNKFYVGMRSTDRLDDDYLGSGKILGYSVAKHGKENHRKEILEYLPTREALQLREAELVDREMLDHPLNMNLKYGGDGGGFLAEANKTNGFHLAGWKSMSKEKDHVASARKIWERHREKMIKVVQVGQAAMTNAAASEEANKKRIATFAERQHAQGEKNSQFGTCWVYNQEHTLKIKKHELEQYLQLGYARGRK